MVIFFHRDETIWKKLTAHRSGHLTVNRSEDNIKFELLENFFESAAEFEPHIMILSGFQLIHNYWQYKDFYDNKFRYIRGKMIEHKDYIYHVEMDVFNDDKMYDNLLDKILPYTDSLG